MKNSNFNILLLLFLFSINLNSQSRYEITNFSLERYIYGPDLLNSSVNFFNEEDEALILENNSNGQSVYFDKVFKGYNNGLEILVGLKERDKIKGGVLTQAFSIGMSYRNLTKNAIQYYEKKPGGQIVSGDVWEEILKKNSNASGRVTTYEIQSKVISIELQEMIWLFNEERFNFGLGAKIGMGLELNSTLIRSEYAEGYENIGGLSEKFSDLVFREETKSKTEMLFSGSIPLRFSFRLSKHPEKRSYNLKLQTSFQLGFNSAISNSFNRHAFVGLSIGLKYKL